jgi:hypothetical protein
MAIVTVAEASQTATIGTEHTLTTQTGIGTYVLTVDTMNMVNGDVLELRIYTKVRASGNTQLAYSAVYAHAQGVLNKYSVPIPLPTDREIIFTLKQTAPVSGGRAFPWGVLTL